MGFYRKCSEKSDENHDLVPHMMKFEYKMGVISMISYFYALSHVNSFQRRGKKMIPKNCVGVRISVSVENREIFIKYRSMWGLEVFFMRKYCTSFTFLF